jgi:hypothetical protein
MCPPNHSHSEPSRAAFDEHFAGIFHPRKVASTFEGEVSVKITKIATPVSVVAIMIGVAAGTVAPASAASNIKPFGQPETLLGPNDAPQITYTVDGLKPSSDAVPHNGQLYEANVKAEGGIPIMTMFNARAQSGANYRVIGGSIPGKLYFDVVGDVPNSVVYNDGVQDLLTWIPGRREGGTRP